MRKTERLSGSENKITKTCFLDFFFKDVIYLGEEKENSGLEDGIKNLIAVSSGMRKQKHLVRTGLQLHCEGACGERQNGCQAGNSDQGMGVRACVFNGKVVNMFNAHYRKSTEKDKVNRREQ